MEAMPSFGVDPDEELLIEQVSKLALAPASKYVLWCDAGYGLPTEVRPRKEKISAIAKQLFNFLVWQTSENSSPNTLAVVKVVGNENCLTCLRERLEQLWPCRELPSHVEFTSSEPLETLSKQDVVYLSPDATKSLDPNESPPSQVVVGMLIDRRIQPNRSRDRAKVLQLRSAQWPLEELNGIHKDEPLNIDTILEGMQQWWWNCHGEISDNTECFVLAATQAIERHARRHPNRPLHKT